MMLRVLDVLSVGTKLSVTLQGKCDNISNGSHLIDENGNTIIVESVAMTRYNNPHDVNNSTTILIDKCNLRKGCQLFLA